MQGVLQNWRVAEASKALHYKAVVHSVKASAAADARSLL